MDMWNDHLKRLFETCKKKILYQVREGVRKYDTSRMTCLQTDFSKTGLGYLLLQKSWFVKYVFLILFASLYNRNKIFYCIRLLVLQTELRLPVSFRIDDRTKT